MVFYGSCGIAAMLCFNTAQKNDRGAGFLQPPPFFRGNRFHGEVQPFAEINPAGRRRIGERRLNPIIGNSGSPAVENRDSGARVAPADQVAGHDDALHVDDRRDPVRGRRAAAAHHQNRRQGGMAERAVRQGIAPNCDVPGHRPLQPEKLRFQDDSVEGGAFDPVVFDPAVGGFQQDAAHMAVVKMVAADHRAGAAVVVVAREVARLRIPAAGRTGPGTKSRRENPEGRSRTSGRKAP